MNRVYRGQTDVAVSGALGPGAGAALVGLAGDRGYWVLPAGVPDVTAPDQPTFAARLDFAADVPLGPRTLEVRAVDGSGRAGAPLAQALEVADRSEPSGPLAITLTWDSDADLDLHVVEPSGDEVWARQPRDAAGIAVLDVDSNDGCRIDGRRRERVVWSQPPAAGAYAVRVDTFSLCAASFANWTVQVTRDGAPALSASGFGDEVAARGPHGRGAGTLALAFTLP